MLGIYDVRFLKTQKDLLIMSVRKKCLMLCIASDHLLPKPPGLARVCGISGFLGVVG